VSPSSSATANAVTGSYPPASPLGSTGEPLLRGPRKDPKPDPDQLT